MSSNVTYLLTADGTLNITLVQNKKSRAISVPTTHPNYVKIKAARKRNATADDILALCDIPKAVARKFSGRVEIKGDQVLLDGKPMHGTIVARMLDMVSSGEDVQGLCKFIENLDENPDSRAVNELFDFLDAKGMPITDDGCFLAYKGVRKDWKDVHSGTNDNRPGCAPIAMKRNQVDADRRNECSYGLHVGRFEYAKSFAPSDGHVVLVKVNPADAVAVPHDHNFSKLRVCSYEVLAEHKEDSFLDANTATAKGQIKSQANQLEAKIAEYEAEYTPAEAADEAYNLGLFSSLANARKAGKHRCCVRLAEDCLGLIDE